jgi:hypothetical protein
MPWYCVLKDDLRFVYCGRDRAAAEAAHVPGTHLAVGRTYGDALRQAAIETGQAKRIPQFVSVLSPNR